jgi:HAD superfamily hydrolase (TIGR01509 family)
MAFDLVIFDCDGVLVDSELISNTVLAAMLTEIGLPVTYEESVRLFLGRSWAACTEIIEARLGRLLPDGFRENYYERMFEAFKKDLRPVPGIVDVLDSIDIPYCVASSGEHYKMRTTLGVTGLLPGFEGKMFSATEVERGKPAPDLFLYAAAQMNASPERCAVVEDSPTGAKAGVAAGMTVFGYAGMSDGKALKNAGAHVFSKMSELIGLLNQFKT